MPHELLGMRDSFAEKLNTEELALLKQLHAQELDFLVPKLSELDIFQHRDDLEAHLLAYKRFMFFKARNTLKARAAGQDSPVLPMYSEKVDAIWHMHILHTREYAEFCQSTVDSFIHHVPCSMFTVHTSRTIGWQARRMLNEIKKAFGALPEDVDPRLLERPHCG